MNNSEPPLRQEEEAHLIENDRIIEILDKYFSTPVPEDQVPDHNDEKGKSSSIQVAPELESESEDDEPLLDGPQFMFPGDFIMDPSQKFIFHGPFDTKQAKTLKIFNKSESKIAFKIDVFSQGRIELSNTIGVIPPGELTRVEVRTISLRNMPKNKDRIQVDVMNAPEGELEGSWFWKDGTRIRRSLTVKYMN